MRKICEREMLAALWGGAVLGGGGGGDPKAGYRLGKAALERGDVLLASVDELDPEGVVVTAGLVGSPKAGGLGPDPESYVNAFLILEKIASLKIAAVNSNESGGVATVNGWLQASGLGVPVVDAPCNGRAHPTALMGGLGLHRDPSYISRQAACGRKSRLYVEGSIENTSALVRALAAREGLVAVARNPVTAAYLGKHGAKGAISMAIELGKAMADVIQERFNLDPLKPEFVGGIPADVGSTSRASPASGSVVMQTCESAPAVLDRWPGYVAAKTSACFLGGELVCTGEVTEVSIETKGGFDVGKVLIREFSGNAGTYEIAFMNEYLTLEVDRKTLFSFPDLIAVFDLNAAWPVSSAEIREGQKVAVLGVPGERLSLGSGMYDKSLYAPLEEATGKTFRVPERGEKR